MRLRPTRPPPLHPFTCDLCLQSPSQLSEAIGFLLPRRTFTGQAVRNSPLTKPSESSCSALQHSPNFSPGRCDSSCGQKKDTRERRTLCYKQMERECDSLREKLRTKINVITALNSSVSDDNQFSPTTRHGYQVVNTTPIGYWTGRPFGAGSVCWPLDPPLAAWSQTAHRSLTRGE